MPHRGRLNSGPVNSKHILHEHSLPKLRARNRGPFFRWAVHELGYIVDECTRHPGITQPAVEYAVRKGDALAKEHGFRL